jgi:hypothetical protein
VTGAFGRDALALSPCAPLGQLGRSGHTSAEDRAADLVLDLARGDLDIGDSEVDECF